MVPREELGEVVRRTLMSPRLAFFKPQAETHLVRHKINLLHHNAHC